MDTHGVGEREESRRKSHGLLCEHTIIIESRSHFNKNSGTFLAIFETILCSQSLLIRLFTEVIRDLFVTNPNSLLTVHSYLPHSLLLQTM